MSFELSIWSASEGRPPWGNHQEVRKRVHWGESGQPCHLGWGEGNMFDCRWLRRMFALGALLSFSSCAAGSWEGCCWGEDRSEAPEQQEDQQEGGDQEEMGAWLSHYRSCWGRDNPSARPPFAFKRKLWREVLIVREADLLLLSFSDLAAKERASSCDFSPLSYCSDVSLCLASFLCFASRLYHLLWFHLFLLLVVLVVALPHFFSLFRCLFLLLQAEPTIHMTRCFLLLLTVLTDQSSHQEFSFSSRFHYCIKNRLTLFCLLHLNVAFLFCSFFFVCLFRLFSFCQFLFQYLCRSFFLPVSFSVSLSIFLSFRRSHRGDILLSASSAPVWFLVLPLLALFVSYPHAAAIFPLLISRPVQRGARPFRDGADISPVCVVWRGFTSHNRGGTFRFHGFFWCRRSLVENERGVWTEGSWDKLMLFILASSPLPSFLSQIHPHAASPHLVYSSALSRPQPFPSHPLCHGYLTLFSVIYRPLLTWPSFSSSAAEVCFSPLLRRWILFCASRLDNLLLHRLTLFLRSHLLFSLGIFLLPDVEFSCLVLLVVVSVSLLSWPFICVVCSFIAAPIPLCLVYASFITHSSMLWPFLILLPSSFLLQRFCSWVTCSFRSQACLIISVDSVQCALERSCIAKILPNCFWRWTSFSDNAPVTSMTVSSSPSSFLSLRSSPPFRLGRNTRNSFSFPYSAK